MSGKRNHSAEDGEKQLAKRQYRLAKLQRRLARLNLQTDDITGSLPRKWIFSMVQYLPLSGLCKLAVSSKTWFILFNHDDFAFWKQLSARHGAGKFAFTNISLKPWWSTYYYLCEFGASFCNRCGMFSGGGEQDLVPISVYMESVEQPGHYHCINPACKAQLEQRIGNIQLPQVFEHCVKSSRKAEKDHTWKTLQRDFRLPSQEPVHEEYQYCERCGLLQLDETYNDSDYCEGCCHLKDNCECEQCERCGLLPLECECELCGDCGRCEGCEGCDKTKKRLCKCVFCDECGGNIRKNGCECL